MADFMKNIVGLLGISCYPCTFPSKHFFIYIYIYFQTCIYIYGNFEL